MEDPTEKHISDVGILNKYDYYYYIIIIAFKDKLLSIYWFALLI